jgi:O-antigen/teichoic acid export membrane protein
MSLKKNLIANYLGQTWTTVMGLAFVPLYIDYLGMEAFGLIGLFTVMKAWLSLMDMGMTPTLNREMARYTGGAHTPQSIRELLHTLEITCYSLAILIALGVWVASGYLANDWLRHEHLSSDTVTQAVSIMALVISLRFCEGIYRGSLQGLQEQVWLNGASAAIATAGSLGAIVVLAWISPTIVAFFIWQASIAVVTLAILARKLHKILPGAATPTRFSRTALAGVWEFASGMMGISLLALLLTQIDKILLSRLVSLTEFGYYTFATAVSGILYLLIGPVTQAIYPRMVELSSTRDKKELINIYHHGAQLVTVLTGPAALLLCFYAGGIIYLWSGNTELTENTSPILSVLALGAFLNGLMRIPYQLQLAYGWTSLTLNTNIVAVVTLIPSIFFIVPRYGAIGAAWLWVLLNAGYVLIELQLMHRKLMIGEKWRWYLRDVALPLFGASLVLLVSLTFQPARHQDRWQWLAFLTATGILALLMSALMSDRIRPYLKSAVVRCRTNGNA